MTHPIEKLITDAGGRIDEPPTRLPDGSGYCTASFPLPADHWLTQPGDNEPPMPFRMGTDNPMHAVICEKIRQAGKYAVRCATMNGKDDDFDPDALIQNLIVGMIGYHTPDGLSHID